MRASSGHIGSTGCWAQHKRLARGHGYGFGVEPGVRLLEFGRDIGVKEISIYGFTRDNNQAAGGAEGGAFGAVHAFCKRA